MSVSHAIEEANALLPGIPVENGVDSRWQAIIAVSEHIESEPEAVWSFVRIWGAHPQEDLRDAIATCLIEHLLEHHFALIFPRVEQLALSEPLIGDTFLRTWKFGKVEETENSKRFDQLRLKVLEKASV